jgi:hypothetical protein
MRKTDSIFWPLMKNDIFSAFNILWEVAKCPNHFVDIEKADKKLSTKRNVDNGKRRQRKMSKKQNANSGKVRN